MATPKRRSTKTTHNAADVRRKIIPARDVDPINSMLVYARNKVGKTRLCATAGLVGKTLIIDCEKGTKSIRGSKNVDVYKLTSWEEIEEIYWYLATQTHPYKFVCIDPITRLGQLCMTYVLESGPELGKQAWGKTAELERDIILRYKELPGVFLIITAYERRRDTDDEDSDYDFVIGPDAQPAVKGFLMGQMDIICRLYIKQLDDESEEGGESRRKTERRLLSGSHEIYEAGDRSGNLPYVMRNPSIRRIMERITGAQSE